VEEILTEIEWGTLLFFAALFVLVGVMEKEGVIEWIARNIFLKAGGNPYVMVLMVLWVSGIVSGFIDNIPFTITMIPIVQLMMEAHPIPHGLLWWALALGACFGGNLTAIGASANIVSCGMARKYGYDISFWQFFKTSAATVGSASIAGLCHLNRIPVYLLVTTLKFAHKGFDGQSIHHADQRQSREDVTYMRSTFSHDVVELDLIDHVITEEGEIPAG